MDLAGEEGGDEPLYENWESGPGKRVLSAHEAAVLYPYGKDSEV